MKQLPILALLRCWRQNEIAHVSCMYNSPQVNGWQQFNSFRLKSGLFPAIGPHGEKRHARFGIKFLVQTETKKWWSWYVWRASCHPPLREVTINCNQRFELLRKGKASFSAIAVVDRLSSRITASAFARVWNFVRFSVLSCVLDLELLFWVIVSAKMGKRLLRLHGRKWWDNIKRILKEMSVKVCSRFRQ
jgi:hypothetical protein